MLLTMTYPYFLYVIFGVAVFVVSLICIGKIVKYNPLVYIWLSCFALGHSLILFGAKELIFYYG